MRPPRSSCPFPLSRTVTPAARSPLSKDRNAQKRPDGSAAGHPQHTREAAVRARRSNFRPTATAADGSAQQADGRLAAPRPRDSAGSGRRQSRHDASARRWNRTRPLEAPYSPQAHGEDRLSARPTGRESDQTKPSMSKLLTIGPTGDAPSPRDCQDVSLLDAHPQPCGGKSTKQIRVAHGSGGTEKSFWAGQG